MIIRSLPLVTRSEMNSRDCWQVKSKRLREHRLITKNVLRVEAKALHACYATREKLTRLVERPSALFVVTLVRVAPSAGLDDDNLRASMKGVRDGVADAIGIDDGSKLIEWRYGQRRGRARQYAVEITIAPREGFRT